jgi:hypothetical protein
MSPCAQLILAFSVSLYFFFLKCLVQTNHEGYGVFFVGRLLNYKFNNFNT